MKFLAWTKCPAGPCDWSTSVDVSMPDATAADEHVRTNALRHVEDTARLRLARHLAECPHKKHPPTQEAAAA